MEARRSRDEKLLRALPCLSQVVLASVCGVVHGHHLRLRRPSPRCRSIPLGLTDRQAERTLTAQATLGKSHVRRVAWRTDAPRSKTICEPAEPSAPTERAVGHLMHERCHIRETRLAATFCGTGGALEDRRLSPAPPSVRHHPSVLYAPNGHTTPRRYPAQYLNVWERPGRSADVDICTWEFWSSSVGQTGCWRLGGTTTVRDGMSWCTRGVGE
jgi:hypothetical protein